MYRALIAFGGLIARMPERGVQGLAWILGALFFVIPSKRRHIIYSNLHHAFPDCSRKWLKDTVWAISQRTAEMGLFTVACPQFSKKRFLNTLDVPESVETRFKALLDEGRPILIFGIHYSMIEAFNAWPGKASFPFPETAVMYRPHKNPEVDRMIKEHRERAGLRLVSRKEGVKAMGEVLRRNGIGAVLFDQNTRDAGTLIPFFGRVTSASELPALLAKKYQAVPVVLESYRTRFWRASIDFDVLDAPLEPVALTLAANQWLEQRLTDSPSRRIDWLWSHNRWKILFRAHERLGMNHRKKGVDFHTYPERKTRFAVVLDQVEPFTQTATAFFQALRQSRPDAAITLIARDAPEYQSAHPEEVDRGIPLPDHARQRRRLAKELRHAYLDLIMVMAPDGNLRRFAKQTHTPQRFGVVNEEDPRTSLTDTWKPPDPDRWHDSPDWIAFGRSFGLEVPESATEKPFN